MSSTNLSPILAKLREEHGVRWYDTDAWQGYVRRLASGESQNRAAMDTLGKWFQYPLGALRRPFMPKELWRKATFNYRFRDEQPTEEEVSALRGANRVIPRQRKYWEAQDASVRGPEPEVSQLDRIEAKLDRLVAVWCKEEVA